MRWAPLAGALALLLAGCGSTPATIAFTSTRDGNAEVYVMRADGSHVRDLSENLAQDGQPSWSPNGKQIAFVSARDGNEQIYVMNADGSAQHRVTHSNDGDTAPVWSPDGTKIAFMCTSVTPRLITEVCVVNVDGSDQKKLTSLAQGENLYPQWSPDSKTVLYTRPGDVAEKIFAPNGASFAYLRRDSTWALYVDTKKVSAVAGNVDSPAWAPDSRRLAFVGRIAHSDLYVIDQDGSGQKQLTKGPGNSLSPRWSPNGKQIAFERLRGNSSQVYVVNADGTGETQLTHEGKNGGPVWRP